MKGSRLYIDLFKVFRDVAETRNFSKAAERNYITQSAVSQQVAFLERYFGKWIQEHPVSMKFRISVLSDLVAGTQPEPWSGLHVRLCYEVSFYFLM